MLCNKTWYHPIKEKEKGKKIAVCIAGLSIWPVDVLSRLQGTFIQWLVCQGEMNTVLVQRSTPTSPACAVSLCS
jgi:hypothetical protein